MAITYTLEEAAVKIGIPPEEFRKRLKFEWTHLRPMRDGSTLRFKEKDIDELARQVGFGSEEELRLADPSSQEMINIPSELDLSDDEAPRPKSPTAKISSGKSQPPLTEGDEAPLFGDDPMYLGDKEVFLLSDDPAVPRRVKSPSSAKIQTVKKPSSKKNQVVKPGGDSDVRLERGGKKSVAPATDSSTEEIELDVLQPSVSSSGKITGSSRTKLSSSSSSKMSPGSSSKIKPGGSSMKLPAGRTGKLPPAPQADSSEFELTLDPDSSDEFELSLASDSSDEISLGDLPVASSGKTGASGINLGRPADSGINLEKRGGDSSKKKLKGGDSGSTRKSGTRLTAPMPESDEEIDFELSLDQAGASSKKLGSSSKNLDSDSEFELTLDETSDIDANLEGATTGFPAVSEDDKNDIFETDFEIPALDDDSASEAIAIDEADTDLESSSDFDLAIDESDGSVEDESASQVVVLDDETDEPPIRPNKKKPSKGKKAVDLDDLVVEDESAEDAVSFDDMEMDESISASMALKGAIADGGDDDVEDEAEATQGKTVVISQTANWGVFPALLMLPTIFVMFLGGLMAYELMHSMWGYQQPTKPASLVIDNVAKAFDMQPKE